MTPGLADYKRSYPKIWVIITNGLPVVYIVFIIFTNFAKIFKQTEANKKIIFKTEVFLEEVVVGLMKILLLIIIILILIIIIVQFFLVLKKRIKI